MKQFIVTLAAFLLLIAFPIQMMLDDINNIRASVAERIVESYAEKAKIEGCFTPELITDMQNALQENLKISGLAASDIIVDCTTEVKYRASEFDMDNMIKYSVVIPLKGNSWVDMGVFAGLNGRSPRQIAVKGFVPSEVLP